MAFCIHCGSKMDEFDIYGNEGLFCPNDCQFEIARKEHEENLELTMLYEAERPIPPEAYIKTTHCWQCGKDQSVYRTAGERDGCYGHRCRNCGYSLRFHHEYGEGGPKDLAKRVWPGDVSP